MSILPGHCRDRAAGEPPVSISLTMADGGEWRETPLDDFEEKLTVLVQVGNELSNTSTFDELCRLAVEMGRSRLGFERLGLWFCTEIPNLMVGSYGVDESGNLRDERGSRVRADAGSNFHRILNGRMPLVLSQDAPIHDNCKSVVGRGSHAVAALWDGQQIIGCLSADNHLSEEPITERQARLLTLFASTLGHLCSRKRAEEELARKESALRRVNDHLRHAMTETHHRVKNNLQIIAAMVDLQAMDHPEFVPTSEVRRLNGHVRTLAMVHDILTEQAKMDGQAERVPVTEVLDRLVPLLELAAGGRRIHVQLDELLLPTRQVTTMALVTNELIGNALKHGAGDVRVDLRLANGEARLTVRDQGTGFPAGFDPTTAARTGLDLVRHLTRWDLGGESFFENDPAGGACAIIVMPAGMP